MERFTVLTTDVHGTPYIVGSYSTVHVATMVSMQGYARTGRFHRVEVVPTTDVFPEWFTVTDD